MAASFTLFVSAVATIFPDNVSDPYYSRWSNTLNRQFTFAASDKTVENIALDDTDTRTVFIPANAALADQRVIMLRVIGSAQLTIVGKDTDGVTTITGYQSAYGTNVLPGIIFLTAYNITSFTITGKADGTRIDMISIVT